MHYRKHLISSKTLRFPMLILDNLVTTNDGHLNISVIHEDISFKAFTTASASAKMGTVTKNYQSGMIQGWNKFCFLGGIATVRAKLPGKYDIGGLWPAIWLMGNLARATYVGSSNNMWPWSYDVCDRKKQASQLISACNIVNHYNLKSREGRGAPEIDILEVMGGVEDMAAAGLKTTTNKPYLSSSLQVSPGILKNRPNTGTPPAKGTWYEEGIEYGPNTTLNIFFYGEELAVSPTERDLTYVADAISGNTNIGPEHFEEFHEYTVDWQPGESGYIKWYINGIMIHSINASTLNVTGGMIPDEPMYLLMNVAMSSTWGFVSPPPPGCGPHGVPCFDCGKPVCSCACPSNLCDNFPAHMLIDSVRVYQNADPGEQHIVGCSPPSKPTSTYIKGHQSFYMNNPPMPGETMPILPVADGGGACKVNSDCGSFGQEGEGEKEGTVSHAKKGKSQGSEHAGEFRGYCANGVCVCENRWTGPNCLAATGYDDILYSDNDDDVNIDEPIGFTLTPDLLALFCSFVIGIGGCSYWKYLLDKEVRGDFRLPGMGRYDSAHSLDTLR